MVKSKIKNRDAKICRRVVWEDHQEQGVVTVPDDGESNRSSGTLCHPTNSPNKSEEEYNSASCVVCARLKMRSSTRVNDSY